MLFILVDMDGGDDHHGYGRGYKGHRGHYRGRGRRYHQDTDGKWLNKVTLIT